MKLVTPPNLPQDPSSLRKRLSDLFRVIATQVNGLTEGAMSVNHSALTAAPTSGAWAQGDFIRNSLPAELGAASSKYVVFGFVCVASGEPGTWVECRFLTGN